MILYSISLHFESIAHKYDLFGSTSIVCVNTQLNHLQIDSMIELKM